MADPGTGVGVKSSNNWKTTKFTRKIMTQGENQKPTVLVTGATGLLGRKVLETFKERNFPVMGMGYSRAESPTYVKLDLMDKFEVQRAIESIRPNIVVHCAAERAPDLCSEHPDHVRTINVEAVAQLAELTHNMGSFFVYVSTDYVFSGNPGEAPYEVDSEAKPANFYGETKLEAEKAVLEHNPERGIILRVPIMYGEAWHNWEGAVNVLVDMVYNRKKEKAIEVDNWAVRYPTNTEDVSRVLADIVQKYTITDRDNIDKLPKILQFSAKEKFTKYEMIQVIADILGLPIDHINPVNEAPKQLYAVARPYDCQLSSKSLEEVGISTETIPFRSWWQRYLKAFRH